jgi:(2Fe-2S) ferredoxin
MTHEELDEIGRKERETQSAFQQCVRVCVAAGCLSCQSYNVQEDLAKQAAEHGGGAQYQIKGVGCMGLCSEGPLVSTSAGHLYQHVSPADVEEILESLEVQPVSRLLCPTNVPFFERQKKIVLENSGLIDPERIEEYIARDGYRALTEALTDMKPRENACVRSHGPDLASAVARLLKDEEIAVGRPPSATKIRGPFGRTIGDVPAGQERPQASAIARDLPDFACG